MPITPNSSPYSRRPSYYHVNDHTNSSHASYGYHQGELLANSRNFPTSFAGEPEFSVFSDNTAGRPASEAWAVRLSAQVTSLLKQVQQLRDDVGYIHEKLDASEAKILLAISAVEPKSISQQDTASPPGSLLIPMLDPLDFPNIKFWTKKQYTAAKNKKKSSTGLIPASNTNGNVMTWYVETQEGDPVDIDTVEAIRAHARTIWQALVDRKIAPSTWADASLDAHNYYEHHMCRRFPELSYGAYNWKAHMIATENYPSWYSKHVGRSIKIKTEQTSSHSSSHLKRSPSPFFSELKPDTKRPKTGLEISKESQATHENKSDNSGIEGKEDGYQSVEISLKIIDPLTQIFSDPATAAALVVPHSTISPGIPPSSKPTIPGPAIHVTTNQTSISPSTSLSTTTAESILTQDSAPLMLTATPVPATDLLTVQKLVKTNDALEKKSRGKKAKAGKANNPKSICKRVWVTENPHGTEDEFAMYWANLTASGSHQEYIDQANANKQ